MALRLSEPPKLHQMCSNYISFSIGFFYSINKLAKARKMRKPPGTLGLKKFWPGKRFGSKMFGPKILAYLHTFILISGNPTKTQKIEEKKEKIFFLIIIQVSENFF